MKPQPNRANSKLGESLRVTLRSASSIAHRRVLEDMGRGHPQDIPMSVYYEMLKHMVPFIPIGRQLSRVEILQYVIDYIQDLQNALESHSSIHTAVPQTLNRANRRPLSSISLNQTSDKVGESFRTLLECLSLTCVDEISPDSHFENEL